MLANKFKPQYNETIKSLQFRKLYWFENKNVEKWMGMLCMAVVECNYKEIDRQLKQQFIHSLNDKYMLEEIIKELTTAKDDDHITSQGVLAWAKRVEVQRAQAAVLNAITELRQFDKVTICEKAERRQHKRSDITVMTMPILWQSTHAEAMSSIWKDVCGLWQDWTLQEGMLQQKRLGSKWARALGTIRIQWGWDWNSEYWFSTFEYKLVIINSRVRDVSRH